MKPPTSTPFRIGIALLLGAMFVSGCSSSSNSQPLADTENAAVDDANTAGQDVAPIGDSANGDSTSDIVDDLVVNISNTSESEPANSDIVVPDTVVPDSIVPDPMVQNRTQVNFEITVPLYQSNALLVRLMWGENDKTAQWIGDELWSVTADLPTDTEHLLAITFYDNNGDIELGSYEKLYGTGSNAAESYQVSADQFDTDRWDTDGDGKGNLDELIAQTDPLVDEDSLLEIRDAVGLDLGSVAIGFELLVQDDRPYVSASGNTNIDADGNGTRSYFSRSGQEETSGEATRTNTGNSIFWEGRTRIYDGDYTLRKVFTNEVIIVDETTRDFIEETNGSYIGWYTDTWLTNSNLTGKLVEGTSSCKPVSGAVSIVHQTNRNSFNSPGGSTTSISKEIDDLYWRVLVTQDDNETTEYFARELYLRSINASERSLFKCDFVDF